MFIVNGHIYPNIDSQGLGSYRQSKLLYRNRGNGTFEDISAQGGPAILKKTTSRGAARRISMATEVWI
ncbi:MAG: hypothetical protein EXQ58_03880 [Acidobacteria bacterium]|nr:hypothetical protein [Acidobacteriota bacterium]